MRTALAAAILLSLIGCAATPTAEAPKPDAADRCPQPSSACMNDDNYAQCQEIAATCEGEILQLESCPLQFACAKP